jgi:hypothetical protein
MNDLLLILRVLTADKVAQHRRVLHVDAVSLWNTTPHVRHIAVEAGDLAFGLCELLTNQGSSGDGRGGPPR